MLAPKSKKQATRLGDLQKGSRASPAERVSNGACAIAKDAKLVVTPRLELASRHPTNGLRPFAGTLPLLRHLMCALRTGGGSEFGGCRKRKRTSDLDVLFMERATRLELATSTLARWRSTR